MTNTTKGTCCEKGIDPCPNASREDWCNIPDCYKRRYLKHKKECHTQNETEGWEKEFDEQFPIMFLDSGTEDDMCENIKSFISSLLLSERQKIAAEVEGLKVDVRPEIRVWLAGTRETNEAHNAALDKALAIIKEEKRK